MDRHAEDTDKGGEARVPVLLRQHHRQPRAAAADGAEQAAAGRGHRVDPAEGEKDKSQTQTGAAPLRHQEGHSRSLQTGE